MSAKNTIKDNRDIKKELPSETKAPEQEAFSHKPTFGESAERPGIEQTEPEGDNSIPKDEGGGAERPLASPPEPAPEPKPLTEPEGEPETTPETEKEPEDHEAGERVTEQLEKVVEDQRTGPDPDRVQRESSFPTTESIFAAPVTRPHTIDPATGQVHYAGDASSLPGGTAANEGADAG